MSTLATQTINAGGVIDALAGSFRGPARLKGGMGSSLPRDRVLHSLLARILPPNGGFGAGP